MRLSPHPLILNPHYWLTGSVDEASFAFTGSPSPSPSCSHPVGLSPLPLRTDLQNLVFDNYQRLSPRIYDPASPVRIIDIDDESLKRYGRQWPWPRTELAAFVDFLKEHGALRSASTFSSPSPTRWASAS